MKNMASLFTKIAQKVFFFTLLKKDDWYMTYFVSA